MSETITDETLTDSEQTKLDQELAIRNARNATPLVIDEEPDEDEILLPAVDEDDEPEPWAHDTVEHAGTVWEVMKPSEDALGALTMANSKFTPDMVKMNMTTLFVQQHMSEESYSKLYERLLMSNDPFTFSDVRELMLKIQQLKVPAPQTGPEAGKNAAHIGPNKMNKGK